MIKEFLKRPIAYNPIVAKTFGSVKLGILWSQMYYWSDKTKDEGGWIYKTQDEVFDETGLSRKEQETARKLGNKLGVLESKVMGVPPKVNFRVDIDKTIELVEEYINKDGLTVNQNNVTKVIGKIKKDITPGIFNRRFFNDLKETFSNTKDGKISYGTDSPVWEIKEWLENSKIVITGKDIQEFVLYWTEPNKSGTKERWETEKTFDVKRRLLKWMDNKSKWSKTSSTNKKNVVV